ncbi:MAG: S8 family serine peptidase [candidate division Zixibacteria bacterium]|nr:S8 family serine peptidase [candidate division Zixibacteria bacterium]
MLKMTKNKFYLISLLIVVITLASNTAAEKKPYQPGRLLIMTEAGFIPSVSTLFPQMQFSDAKQFQDYKITPLAVIYPLYNSLNKSSADSPLKNIYVLSFPETVNIADILVKIKDIPGIRYCELDYAVELYNWPTDSLFQQQWYLNNTGQSYFAINRKDGSSNDTMYINSGTPGEDINLSPIYDDTPADAVVVIVAIIDSGVDYRHPDLTGNIFFNTREIPNNGVDEDNNGLIDDYLGWDFSGNFVDEFGSPGDNDPMDNAGVGLEGHGTHVAGLVAATQNDMGIAGYPGNVKILPIKIFPRAFQSVTVPAILYAVEMGAKVINLSWGSPYEMDILREAIRYARAKGCLLVAAAGNSSNSTPTVPAAFEETFTVGGTNSDGFMTTFSSFGPFLDISAPARDIVSLRAANTDLYGNVEPGVYLIGDKYILANGTSMAAPIVAGAAAMLWSFNPGLDAERIISALEQSAIDITDPWNTGDYLPGYDTLSGWGKLNVGGAYNILQAPSAYLTFPTHREVVSGNIPIRAAYTGGYSSSLKLYIGAGETPDQWELLFEIPNANGSDTLFVWDSDGKNGYFSFKLETDNGANIVEARVINGSGVAFGEPLAYDTLLYLAEIYATAYGEQFDSVNLSYRAETETETTQLFSGPAIYFDEYISDWLLVRLAEGNYYLFIQAYDVSGTIVDSIPVYVRQTMRDGFPQDLPGFMGFSPGVADIDNDGLKEIVVGCREGVYAYKHDGTLMPGFPILTDIDMRSMPAFDDIDGDGYLDVLMSGDSILVAFNYLGQILPGWPNEASTGQTYFTYPIPVATQLYSQSDSVALYMSKFGEVNAYKYGGESYFYSLNGLFTALDPNVFDTSKNAGLAAPFVTATDLEPDGTIEVVAVYGTALDESGIYIWNGRNGLPPVGWETAQARNIRRVSGGTIADIDYDGSLEIITSGVDSLDNEHIWVTRNGREDMPGWPVALPACKGWIGTSPVCVDLDNDNTKEVLISYYNWDFAHIYAFNHDGTPFNENSDYLPNGLLTTVQNTIGHLTVADIDGDGTVNIIGRGGHLLPHIRGYEKIFVWEPDGSQTKGFPIITPTPPTWVFSTPNTPVIDDLDNDGKVEVLLCGDFTALFVWSLDAPYIKENMLWPKYMGDEKNSGVNPVRGVPTDVEDDTPAVPHLFTIRDNYPNPFNPATTIRFSLNHATEINLDIYNILGQRVARILSAHYPAGEHEVIWEGLDNNGDEVASGVYFAKLSGGGNQSTRKMILVR